MKKQEIFSMTSGDNEILSHSTVYYMEILDENRDDEAAVRITGGKRFLQQSIWLCSPGRGWQDVRASCTDKESVWERIF